MIRSILLISITAIASNRSSNSEVVEPAINKNRFEANWKSLASRELPKWYDEGKVGIFIHWGVYSVPSMGTEWFWNHNHNQHIDYKSYVQKNFKPGFAYQEFARDFTGEHFNATEWVQMFAQSGAKYVVLTSKHHDGYTLWPSKYSYSWNSMDIGLKRDVMSELAEAIRTDNRLKFGLYHSLMEWYNPMYLSDQDNKFSTNEFVEKKVMPLLKELVTIYRPEIIWSEGEGAARAASNTYWNATEFLAWLYNDSPVAETVVTNDRWGSDTFCLYGGFFTCNVYYNSGVSKLQKWENPIPIDRLSWGHRQNAKLHEFITSKQLIRELVITVSCGGNFLVNVGPDKTGLIQPIFVERLRDMGRWLAINSQAIYSSQPWTHQKDASTAEVWYTLGKSSTPQRLNVYASILDYPFDAECVQLFSIYGHTDVNTTVSMLGYPNALEWIVGKDSIVVKFPSKAQLDKRGLDFAWTLEIDLPNADFRPNDQKYHSSLYVEED